MITVSRYANGTRLVSRYLPSGNVACGIWLVAGPRYEERYERGYTHFMEHLLFCGAGNQDGTAIAQTIDALGGQVNALTSHEWMSLYGVVAREDLATLAGMFVSMLTTPRFDDDDVARERAVVMHESRDGDNEDEDLLACAWPQHPLSSPIVGDGVALHGISASILRDHWARTVTGRRLLVVAAGPVDHADLDRLCAGLADLAPGAVPTSPRPAFVGPVGAVAAMRPGLRWIMPAPGYRDPDFPVSLLANHILGGGLGSRLFTEVRTRGGLAYRVGSRLVTYSDAGLWLVDADCHAATRSDCVRAVETSIARLAADGPSTGEMAAARCALMTSLRIEDADPLATLERLALETLHLDRCLTWEERNDTLSAIDPDRVGALLAQSRRAGGRC